MNEIPPYYQKGIQFPQKIIEKKQEKIAKRISPRKVEGKPIKKTTIIESVSSKFEGIPEGKSFYQFKSDEIINNNPIKTEEDLIHLIYKIKENKNPYLIKIVTDKLWEKYKDSIFAEQNTFQTMVLSLYETAARKISKQGRASIAIAIRNEAWEKVKFSSKHPLDKLEQTVENGSELYESRTFGTLNMGIHFNQLDTGILKGSNIRAIKGKAGLEVTFDINPAFRSVLDNQIEVFEEEQNTYKKLGIPIEIKKGKFSYPISEISKKYPGNKKYKDSLEMSDTKEIHFQGIGKIAIGTDPKNYTNYYRVKITLDQGKTLDDIQKILIHSGLGGLLGKSSKEDVERIKIHSLFRTFFPNQAYPLERNKKTYSLAVNDLKEKIFELAPEMKIILDKYLDKMEPVEILKGKIRYSIPGLSEEVSGKGGLMLYHKIAGSTSLQKVETLIGALKGGLLSTQQRFDSGALIIGQSSISDHMKGSADSVFLRLFTDKTVEIMEEEIEEDEEEMIDEEIESAIEGIEEVIGLIEEGVTTNLEEVEDAIINVMIDLKALELGTYQYTFDNYGTRNPQNLPQDPLSEKYTNRMNIIEFTEELNREEFDENEVMIKNRLDSKYILRVIVTKGMKESIISLMKEENLIYKKDGIDYYGNLKIDDFIVETDTYRSYLKIIKEV